MDAVIPSDPMRDKDLFSLFAVDNCKIICEITGILSLSWILTGLN